MAERDKKPSYLSKITKAWNPEEEPKEEGLKKSTSNFPTLLKSKSQDQKTLEALDRMSGVGAPEFRMSEIQSTAKDLRNVPPSIVGEQEQERSRLLNLASKVVPAMVKGEGEVGRALNPFVSIPRDLIQGASEGAKLMTESGFNPQVPGINFPMQGSPIPTLESASKFTRGLLDVGMSVGMASPEGLAIASGMDIASQVLGNKGTAVLTSPITSVVNPDTELGKLVTKVGDLAVFAGALKGIKARYEKLTAPETTKGMTETPTEVMPEVFPKEKPEKPKYVKLTTEEQNAIQKQGANAEMLRQRKPELGLQEMGEGNKESQIPAGESQKAQEINPFRQWLGSQSDVEIKDVNKLGLTGKGEKIGAFTQKVGDQYKVTVSPETPMASYAKEIGRVLSHKIDPTELRGLTKEFSDLGYKGTAIDNFASSVKEVLTTEEGRLKAPKLTEYLKKQGVPFTNIAENPMGTPESMTAKARRQVSSEFESPIKGESHFNSFSKFTTDAELNNYLEGLGKGEKSRGVLTKDIVDDLASQLGIKQADITKVKKGEVRNVEWLRGARQVIADNILEMDKFRKDKGEVLTEGDASQLKKMYLTHLAMIAKVKGLATESARALQEMNRPVSAREFDVLTDIQKQLKMSDEPVETTLKNATMSEKWKSWATEILNLPRVALTSFDMSMPFRQGKLLMLTNPKSALQDFGRMHKAFFNEKYYQDIESELKSRENSKLYDATKLFLTERDAMITRTGNVEEIFYGNKLAEHIPVIGELVKGSERSAAAFMNLMRADTMDMFAEKLKQQGITYENNPKLYKDIAWMIDKMSMRGDIGKLERTSGILNSVFFSIRNQTAKFQLLNAALLGKKILDPVKGKPTEYYKLDPMVRKEIMKTAAKDIGLNLGILGVAALLGAKVETDPRSSDFLKIRIGNTRIDPWAGWQQYMVGLAQIRADEKKSLDNGRIISSKEFPFETRDQKIINFIRKKLAPIPGVVWDFAKGKDITGQDVTVKGEIQKSISPMVVSDFYDALNENGIAGTFAGLYSLYGGGVAVYKKREK